MLYTIVPLDIVLNEATKEYDNYCEKTVNGQLVQLSKTEDNKYSIVRVISTDPHIFLDSKYQPGLRI